MYEKHNSSMFIYYGTIINKSELHNFAIMNGCSTIFQLIEKFELDYRFVGDSRYSTRVVIGKELHWNYGSEVTDLEINEGTIKFISKLNIDNSEHPIESEISGDKIAPNDVNNTFKVIGIKNKPKHLLVLNND